MTLEMSEEFVEWLNNCPCTYFLINNPEIGRAVYMFEEDELEEDGKK